MLDLPELLHRIAELREPLRGRQVSSDRICEPKTLGFAVHGNLSLLQGRRLEEIFRKTLWLVLRFEGLALAISPAARLELASPDTPDPVSLGFALGFAEDGVELRCLTEHRKATPLAWLITQDDWQSVPGLDTGGLDILSRQFTAERFASTLKHRSDPVRVLLLNRRAIDSLGERDADTVLREAGIHPGAICRNLSRDDALRLHSAITTAAQSAASDAEAGLPRSGQSDDLGCSKCGAVRLPVSIRGVRALFCPKCQPRPFARPGAR
jgi:formamidopyrimidine-DNA glycosylase